MKIVFAFEIILKDKNRKIMTRMKSQRNESRTKEKLQIFFVLSVPKEISQSYLKVNYFEI